VLPNSALFSRSFEIVRYEGGGVAGKVKKIFRDRGVIADADREALIPGYRQD
jgi:hypothetical protein